MRLLRALLVLLLAPSDSSGQQGTVPRFERSDCAYPLGAWAEGLQIDCGWLVVPELRSRPQGRTLRLAVAILRSSNPRAVPLVRVEGGPGNSAAGALAGAARTLVPQNRDVIFYDQRGVGYSEPPLCPEFTDGGPDHIRACLASIRAQGLDPAGYSTRVNAEDLVDLRRTLGYDRWLVEGESYGSRLAQELMRLDGQAIHGVALVGPMPPGPANELEAPLLHQRALERVFAACAADRACRTAFPDPAADYFVTYDALAREPLAVPPIDPAPARGTLVLTASLFRSGMKAMIGAQSGRIPLILNEFRRGDPLRAARVIAPRQTTLQRMAGQSTIALTTLIFCDDQYVPGLPALRDSINRLVHPALRRLRTETDCEVWLEGRQMDASHQEPVHSDVPTLILVGEFDSETPPEHARRIASTLSRAYVYELPGLGHNARHSCTAEILRQFREDPLRTPDASCISRMPRTRFATAW